MTLLTPEQKRRRGLMLGVVAAAYVLSFFQRFAPAGIAPDLAAAFHTAGRGGVIGQRALIEAVRREYQKAGRSFPGVPRALAALET